MDDVPVSSIMGFCLPFGLSQKWAPRGKRPSETIVFINHKVYRKTPLDFYPKTIKIPTTTKAKPKNQNQIITNNKNSKKMKKLNKLNNLIILAALAVSTLFSACTESKAEYQSLEIEVTVQNAADWRSLPASVKSFVEERAYISRSKDINLAEFQKEHGYKADDFYFGENFKGTQLQNYGAYCILPSQRKTRDYHIFLGNQLHETANLAANMAGFVIAAEESQNINNVFSTKQWETKRTKFLGTLKNETQQKFYSISNWKPKHGIEVVQRYNIVIFAEVFARYIKANKVSDNITIDELIAAVVADTENN